MIEVEIPSNHPRVESLRVREKLLRGFRDGLVAEAGLIAHGRGEAFDYILGEKTYPFALRAARAAVATMLLSSNPVISVNGNAAALCPQELVDLAVAVSARLEVNLYYRSPEREAAIARKLLENGADEVYGVQDEFAAHLHGLESARRKVDSRGILIADTVLVPLEDGDRTWTLRNLSKQVVAIDLNPFSRTSQAAHITIVDNIVRALPLMVAEAQELKESYEGALRRIAQHYRNEETLSEATAYVNSRLSRLVEWELNPTAR